MSCDRNGRRCADAARRNGIAGHISRYLNTISNWSTYQDVENLADLPKRLMEVTSWFFGLDGRIKGVFGVLIATHLVERLTGAVATMTTRLALRGRSFGRYRGITLRQSPVSPLVGRGQNVLLHGRVQEAKGFYFHESGRTWHCHVARYRVGDTVKTINHIQSLSFPSREFFFDRELPEQDVVDLVLGDKDPDNIPGYIGSINELDTLLTVTKVAKQVLYFANWLLVDEGERDGGKADLVDYERFGRGPGSGRDGGSGYTGTAYSGYRPGGLSPSGGGHRYTTDQGERWTRAYRRYGPQVAGAGSPVREGYGGLPEAVSDRPSDPRAFVGHLWDVGRNGRPRQTIHLNGREVPVRVHQIQVLPDGRHLAEAEYQAGDGRWLPVKDMGVREEIAHDVRDGILLAEGR